MWVKICANTNLNDALYAVKSGADAVGFVFAPSSRQVNATAVKEIIQGLPRHVERVGVFTSTDAQEIAAITAEAALSAVQLHGSHDPAFLAELASLLEPDIAIVPVVHWQIDDPAAGDSVSRRLAALESAGFTRMLIDAKQGAKSGGLGVAFDWSSARAVFHSHRHRQLILAGGLTPANVAEAIRTLEPWGVDVASGVEQQPGRKDHALIDSFLRNAKA